MSVTEPTQSLAPVCILGMHRSGTSMVSQLLNACGLDVGPPTELFAADQDNAEGYWEDQRFVHLNDEILAAFGGDWAHPPEMPAGWSDSPKLEPLRKRAKALYKKRKDEHWWGWKDPRTCLTLKFWNQCIPNIRYVLCLRDPAEVIRSLVDRRYNNLTADHAAKLCTQYLDAAVNGLPKERFLVTHNESYFYDPNEELRRVVSFCGVTPEGSRFEEAIAKVKKGLRKSLPIDRKATLGAYEEPLEAHYARLCAEAGPVFARLSSDKDGGTPFATIEDAHKRIQFLEGALAEKGSDILTARHEIEAFRHDREVHTAELVSLRKTLAIYKKEARGLTAQIHALNAGMESLHSVIDQQAGLIEEMEARRIRELEARMSRRVLKIIAPPGSPLRRGLKKLIQLVRGTENHSAAV